MTCGSKKHIEEALAKIHVHDKDADPEEQEVKNSIKRKERRRTKLEAQ